MNKLLFFNLLILTKLSLGFQSMEGPGESVIFNVEVKIVGHKPHLIGKNFTYNVPNNISIKNLINQYAKQAGFLGDHVGLKEKGILFDTKLDKTKRLSDYSKEKKAIELHTYYIEHPEGTPIKVGPGAGKYVTPADD